MNDLISIEKKVKEYNQLLEDFPCTRCSHYDLENRRNIPSGVWYTPNKERPVMLISNYPKKYDQEKGIVMQTSENEVLKQWIAACDHRDFYLTNAFKCVTKDDNGVSPKKLEPCTRLFLWHEIHTIRPHVIIAMGYLSIQSLFIKPPNKDIMKSTYINKRQTHTLPRVGPFKEHLDFALYSTFHPAYMERGGSYYYDDCQNTFQTAFTENHACQTKKITPR